MRYWLVGSWIQTYSACLDWVLGRRWTWLGNTWPPRVSWDVRLMNIVTIWEYCPLSQTPRSPNESFPCMRWICSPMQLHLQSPNYPCAFVSLNNVMGKLFICLFFVYSTRVNSNRGFYLIIFFAVVDVIQFCFEVFDNSARTKWMSIACEEKIKRYRERFRDIQFNFLKDVTNLKFRKWN